MRKLRVLIVDDSAVIRRLLADALAGEPSIEVVGAAATGRVALAKLAHLHPNLVTLNLDMPDTNAQATLAELRKAQPNLPVLLFTRKLCAGVIAGSKLVANAQRRRYQDHPCGQADHPPGYSDRADS